jgi:hypothetical protein
MSLLIWIKAFGTLFTQIFGSLKAFSQLRIEQEKLRRDDYDRCLPIFTAFRDLLVAVVEKDDAMPEFRKANTMRAQALLGDPIDSLLPKLLAEAFRLINISPLLRDPAAWQSEQHRIEAAAQFGQDKLKLLGRIDELTTAFTPFLRLKPL